MTPYTYIPQRNVRADLVMRNTLSYTTDSWLASHVMARAASSSLLFVLNCIVIYEKKTNKLNKLRRQVKPTKTRPNMSRLRDDPSPK